jgi:hypothetical protein
MRKTDAVILVNEPLLAYIRSQKSTAIVQTQPTGNGKSCSGLPAAGEPNQQETRPKLPPGQQFLALVINNNDHTAMQTPDQGSSTSALRHSVQRKQRGPAMHAGSSFKPCQSNPHRISPAPAPTPQLSSAQLSSSCRTRNDQTQ